jgi:hypothetical protein
MTPARRALDFRSFDDVRADTARLAAAPHDRCGRWDLATTCDHLVKAIEVGLENRPVALPRFAQLLAPLVGPLVFKRMLKTRRMPTGVRAPAPFVPVENCACDDAVARLDAMTRRAEAFPGPMPRHVFFGPITAEQWKQLMLIHCAHHLSFLVPRA